jgi:hypothetical protein
VKIFHLYGSLWSLLFSSYAYGVALPPVPTEPIYFEPHIPEVPVEIKNLSCAQLDTSIRYLHPYTYSHKQKFYYDQANQIAVSMVTVDIIPVVGEWVGLAYLGYSALVEEKENRRIVNIKQKLAMLQQLKAEKHCFE